MDGLTELKAMTKHDDVEKLKRELSTRLKTATAAHSLTESLLSSAKKILGIQAGLTMKGKPEGLAIALLDVGCMCTALATSGTPRRAMVLWGTAMELADIEPKRVLV